MNKNTRIIAKSLKKRNRSESTFRLMGLLGIISAISFLVIILFSIINEGKKAFVSTQIKLDIFFDSKILDPGNSGKITEIENANYQTLIKASLLNYFPDIKTRNDQRDLLSMISSSEQENLMRTLTNDISLMNTKKEFWLKSSSKYDVINKNPEMIDFAEEDRLISNQQLFWFNELKKDNRVKFGFNKIFFTAADSTEPEQAGIWGSVMGSFFTLFVTLLLSFPIAVAAGVFLEELAPKNRFTHFIEVNINNLAAVPSIIFGLLGLAIFLNVMHLPRSAPLVGGMVLALMTLPTIIIATRASLKAVPPSIREAAIGMGATKMQTVTHHVLPLSMPGISTGTIIGMSQALGESAPLLMIGMVAFIVDVPESFLDSSTVLPVQIYLWKSTAARGFVELTAAGVLVLLTFLILMNSFAVIIRKKFENQVTSLIGPSGCGKSTFLRCINRMNDTIDICRITGKVLIDNDDIYKATLDPVLLRARVGMVFQKPNPFPKSIFDNVAYGPQIHGLTNSKEELQDLVVRSLQKAGLFNEVKDRMNEPGTSLSGGQQQRLCIARAIAVSPEIILMDEPCSALDPIATAVIEELIDELMQNYTIVIVTHSMQQAARVSQQTAYFHMGNLIEFGETSKIFQNPKNKQTQDYITGRIG